LLLLIPIVLVGMSEGYVLPPTKRHFELK
jgi:hypothetical protein